VIGGHVAIVAALLGMLAFGNHDSVAHTFGEPAGTNLSATLQLLIWAAAASFVAGLLAVLYHSALKARYGLKYLWPHQRSTAQAMAEVFVIGPDEALTPEEVAAGIDDYLYSFTAHDKWKAKVALSVLTIYPLFRLHPPFAMMAPEPRLEFIERSFITDVVERRLPDWLRKMLQQFLFGAHNLAIIGYYADPRTAKSTGYVPFSKRKRYPKVTKKIGPLATLDVSSPNEVDGASVTADVVIVGSGAAGSVLAYRLARPAARSSCWRAESTSTRGTSPRTNASSSRTSTRTAECRCRRTPGSRSSRASAWAAAP